jgi:hypothetical protein
LTRESDHCTNRKQASGQKWAIKLGVQNHGRRSNFPIHNPRCNRLQEVAAATSGVALYQYPGALFGSYSGPAHETRVTPLSPCCSSDATTMQRMSVQQVQSVHTCTHKGPMP